jgi:hypothetical protein
MSKLGKVSVETRSAKGSGAQEVQIPTKRFTV